MARTLALETRKAGNSDFYEASTNISSELRASLRDGLRICLYVSVRTSVRRVGFLLRSHAPGQQERQSYGPNKSQRFHRYFPRRGIIHMAILTIGESGGALWGKFHPAKLIALPFGGFFIWRANAARR